MSTAAAQGEAVEIVVDGQPLRALRGQSIAVALLASGRHGFRTSARRGEPRGPYCNIGMCFDCVMTVDGQPNVRTCLSTVVDGMRVQTQLGDGEWSVGP